MKGDTLYVTGEQVKYRDSREGIERANRIIMNDLPEDPHDPRNGEPPEPAAGDDGNGRGQPEAPSGGRAAGA